MLTGEIRNQIDTIWNAFWSGGISNPIEVIEQITYLFLRLVMAHLVQNGFMDPKLLYGSPYTDRHPQGLDGIFADAEADRLVAVLAEIRQRAQVS